MLLLVPSSPVLAVSSVGTVQTKSQVAERAATIAKNYNLDVGVFVATLICESNLVHNAVGDNGLARGVAQFHESTFDHFAVLSGFSGLSYLDMESQLNLMAWAWSNGLQSHWSCYKQVKRA